MLADLKAHYAHARMTRKGVGEAYYRLRTARHDALSDELAMKQAREEIAQLTRTVQTLRETLAFGMEARS